MTALYNEIDDYAARWMRNLIVAGHVAPGSVETRSIVDLNAEDVRHATQFHAFAGIAVWSAAARAAGWPDGVSLWTGSCPCQPWSVAGDGGGFDDERHLWPEWFRLISECRPPVIVGEQVASPDGLRWLDVVLSDLEREGYACAAADLCAAGIGAPHQRQRLYFVAYAPEKRRDWVDAYLRERQPRGDRPQVARSGEALRARETPAKVGSVGGPLEGAVSGFWGDAEWVTGRDGRRRAVEPGTYPLAHRTFARVGRLRAHGNAIVRPLAAVFLETVIDLMLEAP